MCLCVFLSFEGISRLRVFVSSVDIFVFASSKRLSCRLFFRGNLVFSRLPRKFGGPMFSPARNSSQLSREACVFVSSCLRVFRGGLRVFVTSEEISCLFVFVSSEEISCFCVFVSSVFVFSCLPRNFLCLRVFVSSKEFVTSLVSSCLRVCQRCSSRSCAGNVFFGHRHGSLQLSLVIFLRPAHRHLEPLSLSSSPLSLSLSVLQ